MAREQDLLRAFIEFADTIVDEYDVVEFLHRLAVRCVDLVDVSEAGIMLADHDGTLHYMASSSERMRLIELFELQHDEGPCLDAFREGIAVHHTLDEAAHTRWPRFAPHAHDAGFESVSAVPMRLRTEVIGALNLFSATLSPLSTDDRQVVQALADIATIGILQARALNEVRIVATQLQGALESRVAVEQAKGVVAERANVGIDEAFDLLRAFARRHNQLLRQTAGQIVDGTLSIDALIEATPTS